MDQYMFIQRALKLQSIDFYELRYLLNMKTIFLTILLLPISVFAQNAQTFEDCILENMRGVSSDVAATAIKEACESKFTAQETVGNENPASEITLDKAEVFEEPSVDEYVLNEGPENTEKSAEDSSQQESLENAEEAFTREITNESLPENSSEPAFPYIAEYEFKNIKGGNFINRKMTYGDDTSFSILVTHMNGYQSNPNLEKPFDLSKPKESLPIFDKESTKKLSDIMSETLLAWSYIEESGYSDIQIESIFSNEVIEDLSRASEQYKTSRKKRWGGKLKPKTFEELQFLPTYYLLVLNVDSVSHSDWMKNNMSEEEVDKYYEDLDGLASSIKLGSAAANLSNLGGPLVGIIGATAINAALQSKYKTVLELARVNAISAYLISKNGIVMWGHKDIYLNEWGNFDLASILMNANFLKETRNIK